MSDATASPSKDEVCESEVAFHFLGETYLRDEASNIEEVKKFIKGNEDLTASSKTEGDTKIDQETASVSSVMKSTPKTIASDVGEDFETFEVDSSVSEKDIVNLIVRAVSFHYDACNEIIVDQNIYLKCSALLKSDYVCKSLHNLGGAICWNYPKNILIPTAFKLNSLNTSNEDTKVEGSEMTHFVENFNDYVTFANKAYLARCRGRFPVPVILYKNKFVCRSGTLAVRKGALYEAFVRSSRPEGYLINQWIGEPAMRYLYYCAADIIAKVKEALPLIVYGVEEKKKDDAKILKLLDIKYICDLMVENRKIHTGMAVSSSEKINMAKYGEFRCLRTPYPGCEFFTEYSKIKESKNYDKEKLELVFNWDSSEIDSDLGFTEEEALPFPEIDWMSYTTWDLVSLTKNYMKLILHYLENGEGGLLIHCISGWDRTPLFISLVRISLWADKLIHKELDIKQMAYFTLGYDWYLFGHSLPTRMHKKEEIMHFCFKFLPEIASAEFSLIKDSIGKPRLLRDRIYSIETLSNLVLRHYEEISKTIKHQEDSKHGST